MAATCTVHNRSYRGDGSGMCDARTPHDGEVCNIVVDELVELLEAHTDFDDPTVCMAIAAVLRQHADIVRRSIGCGHGDSMFPIGGGVLRCAICGQRSFAGLTVDERAALDEGDDD